MKTVLLLLLSLLFLAGCANKEKLDELESQNIELKNTNEQISAELETLKSDMRKLQVNYSRLKFLTAQMKGVTATIYTTHGKIDLKFYPDKAPLHCFNFMTRAESGYYDGTKFHRVMKGFMIQGGDPNTRGNNVNSYGTGGPLVNIPHEFNDIKHKRGILSMARPGDVNVGAGSQFFIMHADAAHLDNGYTAFGEVTSGMEVVDKIANMPVIAPVNRPRDAVVIRTIEIRR